MSETPFKTPLPYRKKLQGSSSEEMQKKSSKSDMEESLSSDGGSSNGEDNISLGVLYDDLCRMVKQEFEDRDKVVDAFLAFTEETKLIWIQWKTLVGECQRLQNLLTIKIEETSDLERNLTTARRMLDEEKRKRKQAEAKIEDFEKQMAKVYKALQWENRNINTDEIRAQLASFQGRRSLGDPNQLSAIQEANTTGSVLSDLSYSRSEDDLDSSNCLKSGKTWKKLRPQNDVLNKDEPAMKKRRSSSKTVEIGISEAVKATTTLYVTKEGPITATSIIESVPHLEAKHENVPSDLVFESWARRGDIINSERPQSLNPALRQHVLIQKTVVMPDTCLACEKKIRFGKTVLRCKECKSYCHHECQKILPLPCVPIINTPNFKKSTGTIGDYTPARAPMIPSLVVHCVTEVEQRGLEELGIYRVPGSEKDVKALKEKLLCARTPINLKDIDIHVICGCLKDFIRSLSEPLVTSKLWKDFILAVKAKDEQDVFPLLYQAISELPQPNRDSLAYIILHLQKVAEAKECKMPIGNIAKIFGPTLIGYSSEDLNEKQVFEELPAIVKVVEYLLNIPADYWSSFVNVSTQPGTLQQTPSTDSLLRPTTSRFFTPTGKASSSKSKRKENRRIFYTPPAYK